MWRFELPVSLLLLLLLVVGPRTPPSWRWWTGTAFGALLSMWAWAWDAYPERIERWRVGAAGERRTERALRPLVAAGWRIRHDLDDHPYGNIDHVVIGPPGVFVLDSKVWSGQVTIEDGVPVVTPPEDPAGAWSLPRLPMQLRAMATGVKRRAEVPAWVQPVVVLWAPFPPGSWKLTAWSMCMATGWLLGWSPSRLGGPPTGRPSWRPASWHGSPEVHDRPLWGVGGGT